MFSNIPKTEFTISAAFNLSSAVDLNLCKSKVLGFFGKELIHYQTTNFRLPNRKSLQTTISYLTKMEESYPNR